jgi:hypothetical protein
MQSPSRPATKGSWMVEACKLHEQKNRQFCEPLHHIFGTSMWRLGNTREPGYGGCEQESEAQEGIRFGSSSWPWAANENDPSERAETHIVEDEAKK